MERRHLERPRRRASPRADLRAYADGWLASRELKPRTRALYRDVLDRLILPALGDAPVDRITPATVRAWWAELDPARPTARAHAYSLLRTIYGTAVSEDVVATNPCRIRGGGANRKQHQTRPATLPELEVIVARRPCRRGIGPWCCSRRGAPSGSVSWPSCVAVTSTSRTG